MKNQEKPVKDMDIMREKNPTGRIITTAKHLEDITLAQQRLKKRISQELVVRIIKTSHHILHIRTILKLCLLSARYKGQWKFMGIILFDTYCMGSLQHHAYGTKFENFAKLLDNL